MSEERTTIEEHIKKTKVESFLFLKTWAKLSPSQKNDIKECMSELLKAHREKFKHTREDVENGNREGQLHQVKQTGLGVVDKIKIKQWYNETYNK